jgi:hypothetical protein
MNWAWTEHEVNVTRCVGKAPACPWPLQPLRPLLWPALAPNVSASPEEWLLQEMVSGRSLVSLGIGPCSGHWASRFGKITLITTRSANTKAPTATDNLKTKATGQWFKRYAQKQSVFPAILACKPKTESTRLSRFLLGKLTSSSCCG